MEIVDATKLKSVMLAKGFGVTGLAKVAGVQGSVVSRLIKANRPAQLPTISKLSKALGISPNEILKE